MHLLYCDETNLEKKRDDFLIYGGLIINSNAALDLKHAMVDLRNRHSIPHDDKLKFNPGPKGLSHQAFINVKKDTLELAAKYGARLIVYLILHNIAQDTDVARRNGINVLCLHFNGIIRRLGGPGLVLVDRFNDAGNAIDAHLREKLSIGLTGLPYDGTMNLDNIIGFHMSAIGQADMPSIVDIALGSLRFAINTHTRNEQKNLKTAADLLGLLSPLFWREENGCQEIPETGFLFSPKMIKSPAYIRKYQSLKDFLAEYGVVVAQQITNLRTY